MEHGSLGVRRADVFGFLATHGSISSLDYLLFLSSKLNVDHNFSCFSVSPPPPEWRYALIARHTINERRRRPTKRWLYFRKLTRTWSHRCTYSLSRAVNRRKHVLSIQFHPTLHPPPPIFPKTKLSKIVTFEAGKRRGKSPESFRDSFQKSDVLFSRRAPPPRRYKTRCQFERQFCTFSSYNPAEREDLKNFVKIRRFFFA